MRLFIHLKYYSNIYIFFFIHIRMVLPLLWLAEARGGVSREELAKPRLQRRRPLPLICDLLHFCL